MKTLGEAIEVHGIDVDEHLDRQMTIPVLTGLQAQGDVMVVPRPALGPATAVIPRAGLPVVRGEFGGHTHMLLAEGAAAFDTAGGDGNGDGDGNGGGLDLGTLTVAEGAVAYLAHPEHAYSGIGPGTYVLRRQRELDTARPDAEAMAERAVAVASARERERVRYVRD
ncbi:hypothetical protein [Catenulispora rubra]|uniref:hypothetical protein n=1 Tax=Catenulispora rubra TaxID=280293 RepID=UPI0018926CC2|nr:hypothetical protein [Catenulispora rubra]